MLHTLNENAWEKETDVLSTKSNLDPFKEEGDSLMSEYCGKKENVKLMQFSSLYSFFEDCLH